jgi:PAS domain S-box-containing protein
MKNYRTADRSWKVGPVVNLTVVAALIVLLTDGVLAYENVARLKNDQSGPTGVIHTEEVLVRLERTTGAIENVISRSRGFLLTHDPVFLDNKHGSTYAGAKQAVLDDIAAVRTLTIDNPKQTDRADNLRKEVDAEFAGLDRAVGSSAGSTAVDGNAVEVNRPELRQIRAIVGDMKSEEKRLLDVRQGDYDHDLHRTYVSFGIASGVSIGLVVLIYSLVVRDVKVRRRAGERQNELAGYNQLLLESTGDGIYGVDCEGRCTFLNAAGAKTLGLKPETAIGKVMHNLTHHSHADGSAYPVDQCAIYRVLNTGATVRVDDEVFFRADGTSFPVEYTSSPIRKNGKVDGAVVTFTDITKRKEAERQLAEAADRFRTLADNIAQLAWMADATGAITWYNQRWYDYTGTTAEEMKGFGWKKVHDPEHLERVMEKFRHSMETGEIWEDTFPLRAADGSYRWFLSRALPIRDQNGRIIRWFGTNTDITEARQIQEALIESKQHLKQARDEAERAREAAEAANVSKSQFLANMSHELRTPLNAVIMYSELLQEEAEDQKIERFVPDLDKIRSAGKHLLALVNGVLDLSKIEAGKMELYLETFDVHGMVEDVVVTIQPLLMKRNNKVVVDAPKSVGDMHGDLTKVRQILFNLLSNASKFTEKGTVEISVTRTAENGSGDILRFKVTDTGIGMTPDQLGKLFQPFTQADASTTRRFGGTGLGLAISRRFCEMMGGSLDVTSEIGHGSTFILTLPARIKKAAPEPTPGVPASTAVNEDAVKVLVIDDEPAVRDLMTKSLSSQSIACYVAGEGEQGLRLAREIIPDLIFLDVLMPKMDGWAVLSAIKADSRLADVPVVMLTMMSDQEMGYMLGASEYLTKPIDRSRLISVIRKYSADDAGGVLIVEDDEPTRQVLCRTMVKQGWTVLEAGNGRIALDRLTTKTPSLILLDLMMPEMDGFEFLSELRHNPAWQGIPVVVLTSKDLTPEERGMLSGKVERILQKGEYSRQALLNEVKKIVATCTAKKGGAVDSPAPPSPGTPGEGRGEGDLGNQAMSPAEGHPNPLPESRDKGPENEEHEPVPATAG